MTQCGLATPHRMARLVLAVSIAPGFLPVPSVRAQTPAAEYRVYTEHPRLFLRPQRLRLLKRERERQSMRWHQFDALIAGGAAMPQPGFAYGLYYAVSGNPAVGRKAVDWALGKGADLRQLALVFDWCQDLLSDSQSGALAAKIKLAIGASPPPNGVAGERDRALAAVAIAERDMDGSEKTLKELAERWWRQGMAPALRNGTDLDPGGEIQALMDLLHALRDNLALDLREDAPEYFKTLSTYQVICNYPEPLPAPENEYRIPVFRGSGEPDLERAALARAGGLSAVAFDNNALENQFLQGWLMQDRFLLRSAFGIPYEFLWANPYQPGLSYAHLPLLFHDTRSGALFLRSSWDEDADWFALDHGEAQLFRDGKISVLGIEGAGKSGAIAIGAASVALFRLGIPLNADNERVFLIGGKPRVKYDVEVDGEEMVEMDADAAGTVELRLPAGLSPSIRLKESPHGTH